MNICEETPRIFALLGYIIKIIQIIVPIIIVVMGSIDLVKAIMAQKEDELKKGYSILIKRIILGVIIFFVPPIVNLVISLTPINNENSKLCFACMSDPKKCMEDAYVKESNTNVECTNSSFSSRDECCKAKYNNEMIYNYKIGCVRPDILIEE